VGGSALTFALLAGAAMATYSIFLRLGSSGVHPAAGAVVVTAVAFVVNLTIATVLWSAGTPLPISARNVVLLAVVGVSAACADLFTLSAYTHGMPVTSSFVIGGTAAVLVLLVGFLLLREPFTWTKLLAVALIVGGIALLHREAP
jgi:drug/metabolite transporter (DMT)-like permease